MIARQLPDGSSIVRLGNFENMMSKRERSSDEQMRELDARKRCVGCFSNIVDRGVFLEMVPPPIKGPRLRLALWEQLSRRARIAINKKHKEPEQSAIAVTFFLAGKQLKTDCHLAASVQLQYEESMFSTLTEQEQRAVGTIQSRGKGENDPEQLKKKLEEAAGHNVGIYQLMREALRWMRGKCSSERATG